MEEIRYKRQIQLNEVGEPGQKKIKNASVLVVGSGGLGCPILMYLTGAGIGKIGIMDPDIVTLSNLQRQILFTEKDIGKNKAICAQKHLQKMNSKIKILNLSHVGCAMLTCATEPAPKILFSLLKVLSIY